MGLLKDLFGGGSEKKAAKKVAREFQAAAGRGEELRNRLLDLYRPYADVGPRAISRFERSLGRNMDAPGFRYDGTPPKFEYEGAPPVFEGRDRFSFSPQNILSNPAYQFRLEQGLKAIDRANAARGFRGSGKRLTDLVNFASGLASTEYENEFARQLAMNRENYQRGLGEYQLDYGREADLFNRALQRYGLDYGREGDIYGRRLGEYELGFRRNREIYDRNQNYLANLLRLARIGAAGTEGLAQADTLGTNLINQAMLGRAQAKAGGIMGKKRAIRNTLSDIAQGIGYAKEQGLSALLSGII